MTQTLIYLIPVFGLLALGFAFWRFAWLAKQDPGTEKMQMIAGFIAVGAMAFIRAEYKVLSIFVLSVSGVLIFAGMKTNDSHWLVGISFFVGAFCSALAGFIGMRVATKANVRIANAVSATLGKGHEVAFIGSSATGLGFVGLGILGLSALFAIFSRTIGGDAESLQKVMTILTGYSFGASSIALFLGVGGGIYSAAADVGADLIGKVEAGIPEDHPLNPATIAVNVGDNVVGVVGNGTDALDSYVGSIIATMVLGATIVLPPEFEKAGDPHLGGTLLPLMLAGLGIITSIIGCLVVKLKEGGSLHRALNTGKITAGLLLLPGSALIAINVLPDRWTVADGTEYTSWGAFVAIFLGLLFGIIIGYSTEYFTGTDTKPVASIVRQSINGSTKNLCAGLYTGMISTALPIIMLAIMILGAHHYAGVYGIALAAVGMLSNTGIQLAVDAYGPISRSATLTTEMSGLSPEVRQRTDRLDAVGNAITAIGKSFAIGSAATTALAMFAAFKATYELTHETTLSIEITDPRLMASLFVGGMLPFLLSASLSGSVGHAALAIINEVRRQFYEITELRAALNIVNRNYGKEIDEWSSNDREILNAGYRKSQYDRCIGISTRSAITQMINPVIIASISTLTIGFIGGPEMLGGLLVGVTACGILMAMFQTNSAGAWNSAKRMIEEGYKVNGVKLGKGSAAHKAAIVGDTVGAPFMNVTGPSLNMFLKLISALALVIAPMI